VNDERAVAGLFDDLLHMRAVEDGFSIGRQRGEQLLDHDAAFRSSPESGSSSRINSGLCRRAAAIRIFWRMPLEWVSRRLKRSEVRLKTARMWDAGLQGILGNVVEAPHQLEELLAGEAFEQGRVFGNIADALLDINGAFGERQTGDGDGSGGGGEEAGDDLDGGGLSGAVGTEEADDLAGAEGQRKPCSTSAAL
jgi:hypothetical protein